MLVRNGFGWHLIPENGLSKTAFCAELAFSISSRAIFFTRGTLGMLFDRPGVALAVLQAPSSLIN